MLVSFIRTEQKTLIDSTLKQWFLNQEITWQWSIKNTSKQNELSERYETLLIKKVRCICIHAKLSKDFYSKCCLVAVYLLNRTSKKALNWESFLITIQRLTELFHRWKLFHLKIFEYKIYSLLKKTNAFSRVQKLKSRAFVKYLVEYDFINIFKIWNLEKEDVSDYRNVIFNETKFYDLYQKTNLMTKSEKKKLIEFNIYESRKSVLNDIDDEWLNLSIQQRINKSTAAKADQSIDQSIEIKRSANIQLSTLEYTFILSKTRSSLFFISQTFLNIIEIVSRRNVNLTNLDEFNVIEEKRIQKINSKYANIVYLNDEIWLNEAKTKLLHFYAVFSAVMQF